MGAIDVQQSAPPRTRLKHCFISTYLYLLIAGKSSVAVLCLDAIDDATFFGVVNHTLTLADACIPIYTPT
jgi:hypothetical protein